MGRRKKEDVDAEKQEALTLEEARHSLFDQFRRSETKLVSQRREQWQTFYELYRSFEEQSEEDLLTSDLFIPMIFSHIESFLPRIVANKPRVEVWGREPSDMIRAKQQRLLLIQQWSSMKMPIKLVEYAKNGLIYGTSVWKVAHRKVVKTRTVRFPKPVTQELQSALGTEVVETGDVEIVEEEREVVEYDGPWVTLCDLDQLYPDPEAASFSDGPVIHREKVTLGELESAQDLNGSSLYNKTVLKKLRSLSEEGNQVEEQPVAATSNKPLIEEMREKFGNEDQSIANPHLRQVHILTRWDDEWVTTCVEEFEDELPPLRHDPNPLGNPFIPFTPIPLSNEPYGISFSEILYSLNKETNVLHSSRMDNILMSSNRMITIRKGTGINPRHLQFRPGGKIMVEEHEDIMPFQVPSIDFAPYRESEEINVWSQRASGSTDSFQGLPSASTGGTATEASLLEQASASRAGLIFQILSEQALNLLGEKMIRINELSITSPQYLRIAGENAESEYVRLQPEDLLSENGISLDVTIDVAASEPGTRQFKVQQASNALQSLANFLPPNHPIIEKFVIQLAQGFDIENADTLMEQGRQQIAQQQQLENAPAQGADPSAAGSEGDVLAQLLGGEG